jgi:hypothetical protein
MFASITINIYVLSEFASKLFPKAKGKVVLMILSGLIFIASLIPDNISTVNTIFNYLTTYFGVVPALVIPLILFIVAKVKKNVDKNV